MAEPLQGLSQRKKAQALGVEPAATTSGTVAIMLRLPDGTRQKRRFASSSSMEAVFDWADVLEVDLTAAKLTSSSAKGSKTFRYPADASMSLADAGIASVATGQAVLFVESLEQKQKAKRSKQSSADTAAAAADTAPQ